MKIAFLCSSLEPGRDGVGDYTRRLAEECEKSGHSTTRLALHDRWLTGQKPLLAENEIRLPVTMNWSQRIRAANAFLKNTRPDFTSLQLVPFGFDDHGLISGQLARIIPDCPWQIMFHELWLGGAKTDSLKFRCWGLAQRRCLLSLVRKLHPAVTHTHAALYRRMLAAAQIETRTLLLFANIQIAPKPDFDWLHSILRPEITPENRPSQRILVLFGSLHPEWNPEMLLKKLVHPRLTLLAIGRLGDIGLARWQEFSVKYSARARFLHLGELPPEKISTVLQFADAGVAVSPWALIEKSGSAAAMIEHGLPVIVTRNDLQTGSEEHPDPAWAERLFPIWKDDFAWEKLQKRPPESALPAIAQRFIRDLETCQP